MLDKEIIFLDTEFSSLDPYKGKILSIGMVKDNGTEFYIEIEYDGEVSDWVRKIYYQHSDRKEFQENKQSKKSKSSLEKIDLSCSQM